MGTELPSFFLKVESHYFEVEYIKVDGVIGCCLDLINKMRWILISE